MKKNKYVLVIIITIIILIIQKNINIYAFEFISTPPIEGKAIDAITGEPIQNVVVEAVWIKWSPGFADQTSGLTNIEIAITDKEGRYRIPEYWGLLIISSFSGIKVRTNHPLYTSEGSKMFDVELGKNIINELKNGKQNIESSVTYKDGTIRYDIKLVGVEEKIKEAEEKYKKDENAKYSFLFGSYLSTYSGSFLKEHWDKKFTEDVFKKWEILANKYFPDHGKIKNELNRLKKEVDEAYKGEK